MPLWQPLLIAVGATACADVVREHWPGPQQSRRVICGFAQAS
jgi:hypothetical protein